MSHDTNGGACEACARACEDCKTKSTQLEKKNFRLAIVLTSALTLLGEQGVKAVAGIISSMGEVAGDIAAPPAGATGSASGSDDYRFGSPSGRNPVFSGWKPPWHSSGVSESEGDETDIWLPPDRDADMVAIAGTPNDVAKSVVTNSYAIPNIDTSVSSNVGRDLSMLAVGDPSGWQGVSVSPWVWGGDPLEDGLSYGPSFTMVPPPETLYVFALGGMMRFRSR